jgi:hypothetical protein
MAHTHRKNLATLLYNMPYGELMAVAGALAEMRDPDVRPKIETQQEFADALYDWAEAEYEDWERAARKRASGTGSE